MLYRYKLSPDSTVVKFRVEVRNDHYLHNMDVGTQIVLPLFSPYPSAKHLECKDEIVNILRVRQEKPKSMSTAFVKIVRGQDRVDFTFTLIGERK